MPGDKGKSRHENEVVAEGAGDVAGDQRVDRSLPAAAGAMEAGRLVKPAARIEIVLRGIVNEENGGHRRRADGCCRQPNPASARGCERGRASGRNGGWACFTHRAAFCARLFLRRRGEQEKQQPCDDAEPDRHPDPALSPFRQQARFSVVAEFAFRVGQRGEGHGHRAKDRATE